MTVEESSSLHSRMKRYPIEDSNRPCFLRKGDDAMTQDAYYPDQLSTNEVNLESQRED